HWRSRAATDYQAPLSPPTRRSSELSRPDTPQAAGCGGVRLGNMAGPGDNTRGKGKTGTEADTFKRAVTVCMRAISGDREMEVALDRKSTRLNSSHVKISYAVFCLKK